MYDLYFKVAVPRQYRLYSNLAHDYFQIMWDRKYDSRSYIGHAVLAILEHANMRPAQFLVRRYIMVPFRCHNERVLTNAIHHNYSPNYWRKAMKNVLHHMHLKRLNAFKHQIRAYKKGAVNTDFLHKDPDTLKRIHDEHLSNHPPRIQLEELGTGKRYSFTATYAKCGFKREFRYLKPTIMLEDIIYNSPDGYHQKITDHVWINYTKTLAKLGTLNHGDKLQFYARVSGYRKKKHTDYTLSYLTKTKVKRANTYTSYPLPTGQNYRAVLVGRAMALRDMYRGEATFYRRLYNNWIDGQKVKNMSGQRKVLYTLELWLRIQWQYDYKHHVKYIYTMQGKPCQYNFFAYIQKHPGLKRMLKIRKAYKRTQFVGTDTKYPISHHELFERVNNEIMNKSNVQINQLKELQNKFNN